MATQTPNMNLSLPTIGVDSGLTWEQNVNSNSSILDGHNHSPGSGVQISPSGLNMNADLPMNGNNLTSLRSTRYTAQSTPLALPADLGCLYVSGVDLYYNDENGNHIQITSGGSVNATSSGISSGTATASFSSSVLVVNSASNTPANIQGASLLLGNSGVSSSKYVTLSPPSALASNYSLNLPNLPAQTNVMTLDTSGNMASVTYDQVGVNMTSVGADAIGETMNATGANAVANTRTRAVAASVGIGGVAKSSSSGNYSTTSTSFVFVSNLSVTIATSGRPVVLCLMSDGSAGTFTGGSFIGCQAGSANASFSFYDGSSDFAIYESGNAGGFSFVPSSSMSTLVFPSAGTYSYSVRAKMLGTGTAYVQQAILIAYEI